MERNNAVLELNRATFVLVTEAHRGMARAFDAARVGVLQAVAPNPLRPSEIGERLDMAPSSVTRHTQALEDAGHVSVEADPDDGRTCLIRATPDGIEELQRLEQIGNDAFSRVVSDWTTDDLHTLTRLLRRLTSDWAERGASARARARQTKPTRWRFRPNSAADGGQR
ncbi:MAG TPA: MarR family transcriptional regulator [Stackebrandtia sp.]|jgi:DNA-binding MarR family transcriptional regulator|uniref:MarR family winged helix-turn-helix transcriptional regulator n=1 Tax=Stackebrandtia sp. TaxID=2023065 RepID=UPI002D67C0EC|nr:MarR family transcriptional regulator [Stackebrandtia sp.]HZE41324.1 MarR family transcriptional regulator [Stackebrandtia sp.]